MSSNTSVDVEGDRVECTQCCCVPPKSEKQGLVECHAGGKYLKNWEKWLAERKQVHERLSKSLNRPAGDLLMNLAEDYRKIQEERLLFGYCKINTNFDKYRGNPAFWKVPVGLTEPDQPRNPIYFARMTKIEQNEIPLIKHVATPYYIKNEKNVTPNLRSLFSTHQAGAGANMKMLTAKINKIEPFLPECEELIIIGQKLEPPNENKEQVDTRKHDVPTESLNSSSPKNQEAEISLEEIDNVPRNCFSINGHEIYGYNDLENSVMKIRLIYECTTDKMPEIRYLKFKNVGLTTLRFYWSQIEKFLLFRDLIKCDPEESNAFYFNTNELLLPSEETVELPIWFSTNAVGNYFEMWEITTKPKMWDSNFKLILNLQGFVYPPNFDEKAVAIYDMLDDKIVTTAIRCCLNDIFLYLKFKESEIDNFSFTEKQLFESANQEIWGIEKRPKYIYDKEAVKKLKLLYEEVRQRYAPKNWNYSIKDLKKLARKKDIWIYVENETREMLKGEQRRTELSMNIKETMESIVRTTDTELEDSNETYCRRLDSILEGLERPCMIVNKERSKYFMVYCIVRNFSFKMSYALAKYENPDNPVADDCYPCYEYRGINLVEQLPERILFEKFDDVWIDRVKANSAKFAGETVVTPKPDILKDVPPDDYKSVFKLYFNISSANEKLKKGVPNVVEEKSKDQEKAFKGGRRETVMDKISSHISQPKDNFDPFAEEYVANIFEKESKPIFNERLIHKMQKIGFDYLRFLIVCTYLIEAIDAMVDALESFKENTLNNEELGELTKCADINLTEFLPKEDRSSIPKEKQLSESETASLNIEEDPYFHNLLDSHLLKNLHTKEYIVEGKRKVSREESMPQNCQETPDSGSLNTWIFKSLETIPESVKSTASAEVQTSVVDGEFKNITDDLFKNETCSINAESTSEEETCQDTFYFMNEEEEDTKEQKSIV